MDGGSGDGGGIGVELLIAGSGGGQSGRPSTGTPPGPGGKTHPRRILFSYFPTGGGPCGGNQNAKKSNREEIKMAELNGCILPDGLYFSVQDNVWARDLGDGNVEMGMTDIAQTMAGNILHCRPKKLGANVKKGKSVATVESGKWVGPVKSPFNGEITARNDTVEAEPALINRSPYKQGWIVRIKADDLAGDLANMVRAEAAAEVYRVYMAEHEVSGCIHCEGFES